LYSTRNPLTEFDQYNRLQMIDFSPHELPDTVITMLLNRLVLQSYRWPRTILVLE
jgi:hypothetical protein